ncbi:hypothetical protein AA23498_3546 [Acetobacter nitrogenifigens DSM 23921 = NBRC 105050]|nr:hypothetical protein AA23498_3546 [Acetobacter nitrogenifigens DSM 23921 = NBRC 105050]
MAYRLNGLKKPDWRNLKPAEATRHEGAVNSDLPETLDNVAGNPPRRTKRQRLLAHCVKELGERLARPKAAPAIHGRHIHKASVSIPIP